MSKVMFIDQFYYPDGSAIAQLLTELTMGLRERGWEVSVVTSRDEYAMVKQLYSVDPESVGITVYRTPRLEGGSIYKRKLLRQLWFCMHASIRLLLEPRPNIYVVQTTPPLMPTCMAMVARVKRRPYVLVAQDLYPEIVAVHGMMDSSQLLYRMLLRMIDRTYQGAAKVISLGPHMSRRILNKGVASDCIREISNWGVGDLRPWEGPNSLRQEWGLEDRFVVLYSGNMGLGHEFETFLRGAAKAKDECPELSVVFIASGSRKDELHSWVREHGMGGWVQFHSYQPQNRLRESLGVADLSLVTMKEGWAGLIVPSKILGVMAMGSPTLYVGPDSDVSHLIERFSAGVHVRNGNVEGVRHAIVRAARNGHWRREVGQAARKGYVKSLSREAMISLYDTVLRKVVG